MANDETTRIKLEDLLAVMDILQKALKRSLFFRKPFDEIDIGSIDYYWEIDEEELYNPYNTPNSDKLSLGQISDDWQELKRLKNKNEIPICYDLKRLGAILRAIEDNGNIALH